MKAKRPNANFWKAGDTLRLLPLRLKKVSDGGGDLQRVNVGSSILTSKLRVEITGGGVWGVGLCTFRSILP